MSITSGQKINVANLKSLQAHIKSINDICYIDNKNMIVTASGDGTCKIFELSTLKLLKKLSFRVNLTEKNYSMRGLNYDNYSNVLYTFQAPLRGYTYLTKWDVKNNFDPISSIPLVEGTCTQMDFSIKYNLLALGEAKGKLIFVDPSGSMKITKEIVIRDTTVKSVVFKNKNVIAGSLDNSLQLIKMVRGGSFLQSFTKLFILAILIYLLYLWHENKH